MTNRGEERPGRAEAAGRRPAWRRLALLGGAAWLAGLALAPAPDAPVAPTLAPAPGGKLAERLVFAEAEGALPSREMGVLQTVALFGLPLSDSRTWSEAAARPAPAAAASAPASTLPRIVQAENGPAGRHPPSPVPPPRPRAVAATAQPAATLASARPDAREPLRLLGWDIPGSEAVPSGRDAARVVAALGGTAVQATRDAATTVGRTVGGFGEAVAETIGLR